MAIENAKVLMNGDVIVSYKHLQALYEQRAELLEACRVAMNEMCNTIAPRNSFTDAVDRLDAAITNAEAAE